MPVKQIKIIKNTIMLLFLDYLLLFWIVLMDVFSVWDMYSVSLSVVISDPVIELVGGGWNLCKIWRWE